MGGPVATWIAIIAFVTLVVWAVKANKKRLAAAPRGKVHVVTVGVNHVNGTVAKFGRLGYVLVGQSSANDPRIPAVGSQIRVTLTFRKESDPPDGSAETRAN